MTARILVVLTLLLPAATFSALAASYAEVTQIRLPPPVTKAINSGVLGSSNGQTAGPIYPGYSGGPQMVPGYVSGRGPYGGVPALRYPTAMPLLPAGDNGLPATRQLRWTYGQVNASSDPFNVWGLSTPNMFVPWSTPMSGWTNAQTWDWWRTRAGDPGPPLPLW